MSPQKLPLAFDSTFWFDPAKLLPLSAFSWRYKPEIALRKVSFKASLLLRWARCILGGGHRYVSRSWFHSESGELIEVQWGCERCTFAWKVNDRNHATGPKIYGLRSKDLLDAG